MDYLADFERVTTTQQRDGLIVAGEIVIREWRTFRQQTNVVFAGVNVRATGIIRPIQVGLNQFVNSDPLPFATAEQGVAAAGTFRVFMSDSFAEIRQSGESFIQLSLTRGQVFINGVASVPVSSLIVGGGFGVAGDSSLLRVRWNAEADSPTPATPDTPTPDPEPTPGGTATNATGLTFLQAFHLAQCSIPIRRAGWPDRQLEYLRGLWWLQFANVTTGVVTSRRLVSGSITTPDVIEADLRARDWLAVGAVSETLLASARAITTVFP